MDKKRVNEQEYGWVSYGYLITELPILGIENKRVIARRFRRYCKVGLMTSVVDKEDNSKTYFCMNADVWATLVSDTYKKTAKDSKVQGYALKSTGRVDFKVHTPCTQEYTNSSIMDSSIIYQEEDCKVEEGVPSSLSVTPYSDPKPGSVIPYVEPKPQPYNPSYYGKDSFKKKVEEQSRKLTDEEIHQRAVEAMSTEDDGYNAPGDFSAFN
jgi:hypothetical protein